DDRAGGASEHRLTGWEAERKGDCLMPQHWAARVAVVSVVLVGAVLAQPFSTDARGATSVAIKRANKVLDLSLPWKSGATWRVSGGPHSNTGRGKPWSSIDFAGPKRGKSYKVRAAAPGIVMRPCR